MVDNMNYHFSVKIAKEVGVDGAIMLENIHYWVVENKIRRNNIYDGESWTYNSKRAFSELFPFWSEKQIRRILDNLIRDDYLKTGTYNKSAYDRTLWYTLTEKGWNLWNSNISPNGHIDTPEKSDDISPNGPITLAQKGQPIPLINTDNKQTIYNNVISYLNKKANKNFKTTTNKTKDLINARLNEGFTEDDFYKVIDNKVKNWMGGDYEKYLRPQTLFGPKFEGYLNESHPSKSIDQKEGNNTYDEEYFKSLINPGNKL